MRACEMLAVFTFTRVQAGRPRFTERSPVLRSPGLESFLKKIREAELKWSTSGRRTMRAFGLWNRGEERYREREEESRGDWKGSQGERGEEELCIMSVFPCLSYFEMWLNGPPSVRQLPGLRAARSPPREPETDRNYKFTTIWIIFPPKDLFKKCKTKWLAWI